MAEKDKQQQDKNKFFVKDGDDYIPRRIRRVPEGYVRQPYNKCVCGQGSLKPLGAIDVNGRTVAKCNKCGRKIYTQHYKGIEGLCVCY